MVNSQPGRVAASSAASFSTARSCPACSIAWSAGSVSITASAPPRAATSAAASATHGPVSRAAGSPMMFSGGTSGNTERICPA